MSCQGSPTPSWGRHVLLADIVAAGAQHLPEPVGKRVYILEGGQLEIGQQKCFLHRVLGQARVLQLPAAFSRGHGAEALDQLGKGQLVSRLRRQNQWLIAVLLVHCPPWG
jgi:hypothetical protein